ncbi:hypothetical protein MPER_08116, partial [Moniliophthora perniciosa FA553]
MAALPDLFPCLEELSYSAFDCQFDEREREEEEQGDDTDDELDAFRNDSDSDMDFLLADIDSDIEFESEDSGTKAEVDDGYEKVGGRSPHAELEVFNDLKTDATPTLLSLSRETNGKVASLKVLTDIADDLKIGAPLNWLLRFIHKTVVLPEGLRHLTIYRCSEEYASLPEDVYSTAVALLRDHYPSLKEVLLMDHYGPCWQTGGTREVSFSVAN